MLALIKRDIRVFLRDKMAFLLSLLSVLILVLLYKIFLAQMQVDGIKAAMQVKSVSAETWKMVNYWLVSGLVAITCMSSTLGAYGISVDDRQHKRDEDFRQTLLSPFQIELAYLIAAVIIGSLITLLLYLISAVALIGGTALWLGWLETFEVLILIVAGTTLSLLMIYPFIYFIRTNSQFVSFSTIIGTVIGFLAGVYIPMASLGKSVQNLITWFPLTGINALLKQIMMHDSLTTVFQNAPLGAQDSYEKGYGVQLYFPDGNLIQPGQLVCYLIIFAGVMFLVNGLIVQLDKLRRQDILGERKK
ncbi:ABC transporter permease [Lactobacillus sp. DCY120]|uniref:ABC transporter permease n=1 Tax=Bombilactobacillus apium TaxID=2675299 RepID=A0A850QY14_9LACO|nr:ABC transporter permease [Bombilactobacillus apium]NVY96724.1 ABC transporter permease [Bombilactobacillus apium]